MADTEKLTRFAVIGAGPVGCIVAAFLERGGYPVTLCDVLPDLVAKAKNPGISITGAEQLHQTISSTCTNVEDLADEDPDVIIIAVKANALALIASAVKGFIREGMYVVSWQNGIDTELELASSLGRKNVMRAVVNYGCGLKSPGEVVMGFHHPPHYIQELDPDCADAAAEIAGVLSNCGLETEKTGDIVSMVWRKTAMNASLNPICALTRMTMAQAINDPIVFETVTTLFKECLRVARANEISLGWDFYPHAMEYVKGAGNHKPSMLMDVENGRRTEINFINGKIAQYGEQAGIQTPYNNTMVALIKGLEKV
ncbi:MAG: 2-dehydropantoate 2-reductase [Desulfobacteraceae bacterium]